MKKIGLIGGTGPESTLIYYRELNRRINELKGGKEYPEIALESVDLYRVLGLVGEEKYDELAGYLGERAAALESGGADIIALTAGTVHVVYDRVKEYVHVPLISIPETAASYAAEKGYRKVGLLGTIFTMEKDYLSGAFTKRGIEVEVPGGDERKKVHERIAGELEYGIVRESTRQELLGVVRRMKEEAGIEAVILGCTELPLILNGANLGECGLDCLDIMELHIRKLVDLAAE